MMNAPLFRERYKEDGLVAANGTDVVLQYEHVKFGSSFAGYRVRQGFFFATGLLEYWQHHRFQLTLGWLPVSLAAGELAATTLAAVQSLWDQMMPSVDEQSPTVAFTKTGSDYYPGDSDTAPIWQPGKLSQEILTNPAAAAIVKSYRPTLGFFSNSAFRPGVVKSGDSYVATSKVQTVWQIPDQFIRVGINAPTNGYLVWALTNPTKPAAYTVANMAPRAGIWEHLNFLSKRIDKLTGTASIAPSTTDDWRRWAMSYEYDTSDYITQWVAQAIAYRLELVAYYEQETIGVTADGTLDP